MPHAALACQGRCSGAARGPWNSGTTAEEQRKARAKSRFLQAMGNVPWQVTMFPYMGVSQLTLRLAQPGVQSRAAGLTPGRSLATHTLTSQPRVPPATLPSKLTRARRRAPRS